ncbi:hypothetical protein MH111_17240 [Bacillus altitudinis]|uniref:hypothetical protein n=1 Tax=Bacillus altitudinis TaxID=293387 RepID=UPI00227FD3EE|nr:hypothetical protein [Bacillus altitudinis]MCY7692174.1 hypothetical protein [Bacillus altitudinis]
MLSKDQINVEALLGEVERLKREIEKKNQQIDGFSKLFLNELDWEQKQFKRTESEFHRGGSEVLRKLEKHYEFAIGKRLDGGKVNISSFYRPSNGERESECFCDDKEVERYERKTQKR